MEILMDLFHALSRWLVASAQPQHHEEKENKRDED